ncbi:MAG: LysM peptidoglycan-binding domain-containing protein [Paraglaciecola sp.]|uniref:LysM peptidoglycan-binding domain-containing protein n=1 Tax=Paraglaciecola sp. TaxID=1920173 RepID=UPI003297C7E3
MACTTNQTITPLSEPIDRTSDETEIKLSHVKAYLMIGNINKAQESFNAIDATNSRDVPNNLITLSELRAATGDAEGAQKAFLLALSNAPFDKLSVPETLTDYLCSEKKWPALEGYAAALFTSSDEIPNESRSSARIKLKNKTLTQIGLCFFNGQQLEQADQLLQQIDLTQNINPEVHLALARIAVEQNQLDTAQASMKRYEATKSQIDAKMLWTAFEVYQALEQPEMTERTGEYLYSLFPHNEYTRKYILARKRSERLKRQQEAQELLSKNDLVPLGYEKEISTKAKAAKEQETQNQRLPEPEFSIHIIKKGETLYQLSKRYDVSIPELQSLNPTLEIDNISVGTKIRITRTR